MQKKTNNDHQKSLSKVVINWYPGHMYKTKKQIEQDIKQIDIVIEIVDSRMPEESRNPDIEKIAKNKKKLILLNKSDLADNSQTQKWINYYKSKQIEALAINSNTGEGVEKSINKINEILNPMFEENAKKGRVGKKAKAMIVGIPNVGKSSYINRVTKKSSAGVENKPGFTKQKMWYRLNDKIDLLDTPGILWPKFEEDIGMHLAMTGSIREDILDKLEVAYNIVKFMLEHYEDNLLVRYKITKEEKDKIMNNTNQMENENIYELIKLIGKKRRLLVAGGKVDDQKVAKVIIDEFKNGKMGKVTITWI